MNKLLTFVAVVVVYFGTALQAEIVNVTKNTRGLNEKLPDANVTVLKLSTQLKNAGSTLINDMNKSKIIVDRDGNIMRVPTRQRVIDMPSSCVDNHSDLVWNVVSKSEDENTTRVSISHYTTIRNEKEKAKLLGLVIKSNYAVLGEGEISVTTAKEMIVKARCMEFWAGDQNATTEGNKLCGPCVGYFYPSLSTRVVLDENTSYYTPDNKQLQSFLTMADKNNKAIAMLQGMYNNNPLSENVDINNLQSYDGNTIPSDKNDTEAARIILLANEVVEKAFISQLKQNTVKCFVRRKLVPKYYCPIPGLEFGAQTGGNPEDDLGRAKSECDSFCKSQSYPCKSAPSGFSDEDEFSGSVNYNFSSQEYASMEPMVIEFPVNEALEMKNLSYVINLKLKEADETLEAEANATSKNVKISIATSIEFKQDEDQDYVVLMGASNTRLHDGENKIKIPSLPKAKKIRLTFYRPTMRYSGSLIMKEIDDIVSSVTVKEFKIKYTDNRYHFCTKNQVILTPAQCFNGDMFSVDNETGSFLICNAETRRRGPELKYGAYYTQDTCESNCKEERECVETMSHYSGSVNSAASFKITVGCVDDPYNTNCSQELCEKKFRDHSEMPIKETVYDTKSSQRVTVSAGVQVEGQSRPRISLDKELDASSMSDFDSLFLDETKDQAYKNMISDGTFQYTKNTIIEGQTFESACRIEKSLSENIGYYSATPQTTSIYWKLKPSSEDINTGTLKYIYIVAATEQMYRPKSGQFKEEGIMTTSPQYQYRDTLYAYLTPVGVEPFYIKEYDKVFMQGSTNSEQDEGWVNNSQHYSERYISYDPSGDKMLIASDAERAIAQTTMQFTGSKNYEELIMVSDLKGQFETSLGGKIHSQEIPQNKGSLPIKHYNPSSDIDGENSAILNYYLYGIYSNTQLTNKEIMTKVQNNKEKYLVYKHSRGRSNKQSIKGDGGSGYKKIKIFTKGTPQSMTLSVDMKPRIEDEGKNVILFMFLFEGGLEK